MKKGWRCAKVTIPCKSVPAMVMDAEGSQAGADLLDANMVYWSTASIDGDGLKLKEQVGSRPFLHNIYVRSRSCYPLVRFGSS